MIRHWLTLFALLALSQQASAFSTMQPSDCQAAWQIIEKGTNTLNKHRVSEDGWCQVPLPSAAKVRLEWRAEGMQRVLQDNLAPTALAIRVAGVDLLDALGEPKQPGAPVLLVGAELVLRENASARQVLIEKLEIIGPADNRVMLQGVVDDIDLSSLAKMQVSMGSAKLRNVDLVATGNRQLAPFLRPYIGTTFSERSRKRSAMIDKVSEWPGHSFPPATKRAVTQLIATLPAPNGTLRATVDTGAGLSAGIFVQTFVFGHGGDDFLDNLLAGLIFHATWTAH